MLDKYEALIRPIETGLTPNDHNVALQQFIAFTELPEAQKELITFAGVPERIHNTHAGYVRKNDKDKKQLFHYTQLLHIEVMPILANQPQETRDFIGSAQEMHQIAVGGIKQVLDEIHPLLRSIHCPPNGENNHHLRYLLYDDASASGHYDQSTLTVPMCETAPGLRLGTHPANLTGYARDPHESLLIAGYGWLNLHKKLGITTDMIPTWHDVLIPEDRRLSGIGRAAIVLFANPAFIDTSSTKIQAATPISLKDIRSWEEQGVLAIAA